MKALSLPSRLLLTAGALLAVLTLAAWIFGAVLARDLSMRAGERQLDRGAAWCLEAAAQESNAEALAGRFRDGAALVEARVRWTSPYGRLLMDSAFPGPAEGEAPPDAATRRALGGERVSEEAVDPSGRPSLVRAEALPHGLGAIRMDRPLGLPAGFAKELVLAAVILTVLMLATLLLAARGLFGGVVQPLEALSNGLERLGKGDFEVHPAPGAYLESRALAANFERVRERLHGLHVRFLESSERLEAILAESQEALLLVSDRGAVLFANGPFRAAFDFSPARPGAAPYWEALRASPLSKLLEAQLAQPPGDERAVTPIEFSHGPRHFRGRLCTLPKQRAILAALHDITGEVEGARTKRDLVANVSHELNTPLTSIKGFLETLEEGEREPERAKLFAIVRRNTERLIAIVKDLLTLSNLDRGAQAIQRESVDALELLRSSEALFRPALHAKGLDFKVDLPAELPAIPADPFRLEQVLVNLLDNACKYTDRGTVGLRAGIEGNYLVITIWDTGLGIPPGHEERIFERFHTVDRSRSRKAGGTGLGLAIVKHIVLLHGGSVAVSRRMEGGSEFRVMLPVA